MTSLSLQPPIPATGSERDVVGLPWPDRAAGQGTSTVGPHRPVARRVAGAAMGDGLDEIGPAIPFLALVAVRREPRIAKVEQVPAPQQPALVEGKSQHRFRGSRVDRTLRHQEGTDRQDILPRHPRIAVIGHRRVEPRSRPGAGPTARPGGSRPRSSRRSRGAIGRDVGRDDRAERRRDAVSAGEGLATGPRVWQPPQSAARARYSPRRDEVVAAAERILRPSVGGKQGGRKPDQDRDRALQGKVTARP